MRSKHSPKRGFSAPVSISDGSTDFELLNVTDIVDCIDREKSDFVSWTEADGRPDKTGQFRMFSKLRIDVLRAIGHHIFRIKGWGVALIASQDVVDIFKRLEVTGVSFELVSTDIKAS